MPTRLLLNTERWFHLFCWPFCVLVTVAPIILKGGSVYGPASGISACYLEVCSHGCCSVGHTHETHLRSFALPHCLYKRMAAP